MFNKNVKMSRTKDHRFFTKMSNYAESKSLENFAHALQLTWWRLHAGGGIGKARTRVKDVVTCSVSDENAPPLA